MKRNEFFNHVRFLLAAVFIATMLIACDDEKELPAATTELPDAIDSYLKGYFPDATIQQIEESASSSDKYNIHLTNGVTVIFTQEGKLTHIAGAALPENILPRKIVAYVNSHFLNEKIIAWDLFSNNREQRIALRNEMEIIFDLEANPIRSHGDEDDVMIPYNELPDQAQNYIYRYFAREEPTRVWKDKEGAVIEYEVYLQTAAYLAFDEGGQITEIEYYKGIPVGALSLKVEEYIRKHFPSRRIIKWESSLQENKQEAILDDQTTLLFDLAGNFIGSDLGNGDVPIPEEELPAASVNYTRRYFPGQPILQVWKDMENTKVKYEVNLVSGVYLEFDENGAVIEVKSYHGIPSAVIPEKVAAYAAVHFPGIKITKWELDEPFQELTLLNGLELVFDKMDNFVKIDD